MAALASLHATAGRIDAAKALIPRAIKLADDCDNEGVRVRCLQRIGFASFYTADYDTARAASTEAARVCEELGYYILAARAYSVLAVTEMTCDEDVSKSLWYTQQNASCAAKGGDRLGRQTALFQMYEIEARRGREQRMQELEDEIDALHTSDPFRSAVISPLRAMRLAWRGDFGAAYRLTCGLCDKQSFVVLGALRRAECAVFLSADGRRDEALRYADQALKT